MGGKIMKFKIKPDRFYYRWSYLYFKHGWWPFWRLAGWTPDDHLEERMEMLRRNEGLL
jgi:hypothetical protein